MDFSSGDATASKRTLRDQISLDPKSFCASRAQLRSFESAWLCEILDSRLEIDPWMSFVTSYRFEILRLYSHLNVVSFPHWIESSDSRYDCRLSIKPLIKHLEYLEVTELGPGTLLYN